ncbi:MAG: DMT family transporter [candidate division Zixibacteria bacterium]|nr:DMT family transporter [candidate division Zixibacteria bacterium]
MDIINSHLGETFSLLAAINWAFAVILFRKSGETVHPIGLNLFKNTLSIVLLVPTIYIFGQTLFYPAPSSHYLLFLFSGALGIGLSDTLFFKSLNLLGAGLSAIVTCMYSPFIIILSFLYLDEALTLVQFVGVVVILFAVLAAAGRENSSDVSRKAVLRGILLGVLSMACNAVSVVAIKPVLEISPLLWVTEIRLIGGAVVLLVVLALHSSRRTIIRSVFSAKHWGYTVSGSFMGAYLAMIIWLAGMKYTQASIAAAINQTSTIFTFVFAALLLREKVTLLRVLGIVLGFSGALLVTFG